MKACVLSLSIFYLLIFSQSVFALEAAVWNRYAGFDYSEPLNVDKTSSLFHCAIQKSGYQVNLSVLPVNRQVIMMDKGLLDIGVAWLQSAEHDRMGVFTKPVVHIELILLTSRPFSYDYFFDDLELATTFEVGVIEMIAGLRAKPHFVKSFNAAASMTYHNRVDGAIVPKSSLMLMDDSLNGNLFHTSMGEIPLLFYVNKKTPGHIQIAKALNQGIDACIGQSK